MWLVNQKLHLPLVEHHGVSGEGEQADMFEEKEEKEWQQREKNN